MRPIFTDTPEELQLFRLAYIKYVLNNGSGAKGKKEQREAWYAGLYAALKEVM